MRAALLIARVNLLRTIRERSSLFFVFLLPLILIIALGAVSGGFSTSRLGVVGINTGPLGQDLIAALGARELEMEITDYESLDALRDAVEARSIETGLLVPPEYDESLRSGGTGELTIVAKPEDQASALRQAVEAVVAQQAAQIRAARVATAFAGSEFEPALEQARTAQGALPALQVRLTTVGESVFPSDAGPFAFGAQSQLILFMFLTSMTAATQLILTRQLGVSRRMLSTRTPIRAILLGELLGRFGVAMMQGVFIVVASALLFDVSWGNLLGASLVIALFALIATGVAMVIGAFATNVDQAVALGVVLGLVVGALGGAMVPGELFDEPISTISRLTPHAWAIDALRDLSFRDAGVSDILVQLGVLVAMAIGLVVLGIWGLRRSLTR